MEQDPLELLVDKLGADMQIKVRPLPTYSPTDLKRLRKVNTLAHMKLVHDGYEGAPPEWAKNNLPSRVVVVWDRPTRWGAPHRAFLRRLLLGAGLYDDYVTHLWAWPYDQRDQPLESQVLSNRQLIMDTLEAANGRYVLLLGGAVMRLWRRDLTIKQVAGSSGVWDNRWIVFPMVNPYQVMREPMLQGEWRMMMYEFIDLVLNNDDGRLMRQCVTPECSDGVFVYDPDGIGWCKRHSEGGMRKRGNSVSYQNKKLNKMQQEGMF